jgi:hypothetical protein
MNKPRTPFLLNPTQSGIFYLLLFLALIAAGLLLYELLNGHYSIIGSVASFLAFFVAFQSWKAADDGSRKTDEALAQMRDLLHQTSQIAQTNYEIDQQIRAAVGTISDATRELHKGYQQILLEIKAFLAEAEGSEYFFMLTDTAAIGQMQVGYNPHLHDVSASLRTLTNQIHDLLIARVRDSREFYLAALDSGDEATSDERNSLYHCFLDPVWRTFHNGQTIPTDIWLEQRRRHQTALREVQDAFEVYSDHRLQREADLPAVLSLESLPFQVMIRVDAEAHEPYKALVIFIGQYNMDKVGEARAMLTADPELVRTFISMAESISGLQQNENYLRLRQKLPL